MRCVFIIQPREGKGKGKGRGREGKVMGKGKRGGKVASWLLGRWTLLDKTTVILTSLLVTLM